jgi:hypothetical protein
MGFTRCFKKKPYRKKEKILDNLPVIKLDLYIES